MSSVESHGRVSWFVNRLRCMSAAEVIHRAATSARKRFRGPLSRRLRSTIDRDQPATSARWVALPVEVDTQPCMADYERLRGGEVRLFEASFFQVGVRPEWNRCPLTGALAPSVPCEEIAITDRAMVGDIKFLWELNRHLHWVTLAQAFASTGEPDALALLREQLDSWLQQCKPGMGPNWTSSLELAIRLINWSVVWQLIGGHTSLIFKDDAGQALLERWYESIYAHVIGISEQYSRYSSGNNHLIGELAGVFVGASTWGCWPEVRLLGSKARQELEEQIVEQTGADGANREQAFEYMTFVYDFFAVVERCASVSGGSMSEAYVDRMAGMCSFVRAMMDSGGHVPHIGDADGAKVLRFHPVAGACSYAAMLQKGAALFGRKDWVDGLGSRGLAEARWLYSRLSRLERTDRQVMASFPEGGYEVFESPNSAPLKLNGVFDVGPLGYLGIAAHGHADALQLCLSVRGSPFLIDPGTYSYWADREWRDYFRGTRAHNTVCVDELDQSLSGGRFMWVRHAHATLLQAVRHPNGDVVLEGSHDGYERLDKPVNHRRSVSFKAEEACVEVRDTLASQGEHLFEWHWHIAPQWAVTLTSNGAECTLGDLTVVIKINSSEAGCISLHVGEDAPVLGWCSDSYSVKVPCSVLRWQVRALGCHVSTTVVCMSR